jgi:anti-anti-sigma factor
MTSDVLFRCRVVAVAGGNRVIVDGVVDMRTAPELSAALLQFANGAVTVDLTSVTFFDSTGLNALARAHARIAQRNDRLVVAGASANVRRVLAISGLDAVLHCD